MVEEAEQEPLIGDFNGDYKVDSSDAAIVLHHILFESGADLRFDVNQDGCVNNDDIREIYRISDNLKSFDSPFESPDSPLKPPDSPFKPPDSPFKSPESPF